MKEVDFDSELCHSAVNLDWLDRLVNLPVYRAVTILKTALFQMCYQSKCIESGRRMRISAAENERKEGMLTID